MTEYVLLLAIYGFASFLQGVVGFGFALLSVPLVATIYDPPTAVAMNAIVGTANCGYKAWLLRKDSEPTGVLSFTGVAFLFVPLGVAGITVISRAPALVVMGAFVLAVAIGNMRRREEVQAAMRKRSSFWSLSVAAGVLSGAFAAPGPAAVPFFLAKEENPLVAKANLNLFFILVTVPVILFHGIAGNLTPSALRLALFYLPVVFLLTYTGTRLSQRVPERGLRLAVDIGLAALGTWLILDNTLI
mgnify:CR=1 FL=1